MAKKRDLQCGGCKSKYTELEALGSLSPTGDFLCHSCAELLNAVKVDETEEIEGVMCVCGLYM